MENDRFVARGRATSDVGSMEISIREGIADDAAFLAWDMLTAARSHVTLSLWDLAFPGPEDFRLAHLADLATAATVSFSHFESFLVAEHDGKPVGGLSCFDPADRSMDQFVAALTEVLVNRSWSQEHQDLLVQRISPTLTCNPETPEGRLVIEWVAVKPEARGQGVIDQLLAAALDRGRDQGNDQAQLGVLLGNTAAFRAYERAGFRLFDEKRDAAFEAALGSAGIARMTVDL
jgi:ribosomal protein S18 acetylase RimI-like enzyme